MSSAALSPSPAPVAAAEGQPRAPCLACGDSAPEAIHPSAEKGFEIRVCAGCGLGRTWPPEAPDQIGAWYPQQYYGTENVRFNPLFERLVKWFRRRRAGVLFNRIPRGPLLDVGCGRGLMLSHLRELGYDVQGIEFSDTAAWHARTVLKLPVATDDFIRAPPEPNRYNAILFWHSLEHLAEPGLALARAYDSLRPGGLLTIAVPNHDSWEARFFGRDWFHLDVPRHYFHFGVRSLTQALSAHGFRVVQLDHFSFEQNPYGILQSLYNRLGFHFNLLYSLLKDRKARQENVWRFPFQSLAIVSLLPLFLPLSLALMLGETALRSGGTIEVYAFKE